MRTLALASNDRRPLEVRLIGYGDRTQAGTVHQGIVPLLEFATAGARRRSHVLALVPVEFVRERVSDGISLGRGDRPVQLATQEVARLLAWVDGGEDQAAPLVIVCGDEFELGRVCAILGRMPLELIRAEKPGRALAALARSPELAVVAGGIPDLDRFVRAASAARVPLIVIGCEDEPALVGADAVAHLPVLDERRLIAAVSELLDFV
jgi:hypothetical protein